MDQLVSHHLMLIRLAVDASPVAVAAAAVVVSNGDGLRRLIYINCNKALFILVVYPRI
jgi:hypothetical protein